jgi:hypothetical protein
MSVLFALFETRSLNVRIVRIGVVVVQREPADSYFQLLWTAICEDKVVEEDGFLFFEDSSIHWDQAVSHLFIRPSYRSFFKEINESKPQRLLIRGTPGIGKSLFAHYLLYAYVKLRPVGFPVPTIRFQFRDSVSVIFRIDEAGLPRADTAGTTERGDCDLFISDSSAPPDHYSAKCRVHVPSDNNTDGCKDFVKAIAASADHTRNKVRFMAPFSEEEALAVAGSRNIDTATMSLRYKVFGGSIRRLLDFSRAEGHIDIEEYSLVVNEAMTTYFEDVALTEKEYDALESCKQLLSELVGKKHKAELGSLFRHAVPKDGGFGCRQVWASDFMKWLAGIWSHTKELEVHRFIREILNEDGGAKGAMFETRSHRTLYENLKAGRSYILQSLDGGDDVEMGGSRELALTHRVLIKTADCLRNLPEGAYAKPVIRNFGAVDAVFKLGNICYLVQMTVGASRPGEDSTADFLHTICKNLGCKLNFKVVFVLADNYDFFEKQAKYGSGTQYKTLADRATQAALSTQSKTKPGTGQADKSMKRPLSEAPGDQGSQFDDGISSRQPPLRRSCRRSPMRRPCRGLLAAVNSDEETGFDHND